MGGVPYNDMSSASDSDTDSEQEHLYNEEARKFNDALMGSYGLVDIDDNIGGSNKGKKRKNSNSSSTNSNTTSNSSSSNNVGGESQEQEKKKKKKKIKDKDSIDGDKNQNSKSLSRSGSTSTLKVSKNTKNAERRKVKQQRTVQLSGWFIEKFGKGIKAMMFMYWNRQRII